MDYGCYIDGSDKKHGRLTSFIWGFQMLLWFPKNSDKYSEVDNSLSFISYWKNIPPLVTSILLDKIMADVISGFKSATLKSWAVYIKALARWSALLLYIGLTQPEYNSVWSICYSSFTLPPGRDSKQSADSAPTQPGILIPSFSIHPEECHLLHNFHQSHDTSDEHLSNRVVRPGPGIEAARAYYIQETLPIGPESNASRRRGSLIDTQHTPRRYSALARPKSLAQHVARLVVTSSTHVDSDAGRVK